MESTYTDGTTAFTDEHCDCGRTAGCEKCQPIIIPGISAADNDIYYVRPSLEKTGATEG